MDSYTYFNDYYEAPLRSKVYDHILDYTLYLPFNIFDFIMNFSLFEEEEKQKSTFENESIVEMDERIMRLSSDEERSMNALRARINLTMEGNLVTVETTMPDPKAAVMLNILVIEKIQEYVTEYQIEKARQDLEFIEKQHELAKERYETAQKELAEFRDENQNITSNVYLTEEERLVNQTNRTFNIYNTISSQLEQARLRLQEETPIFSILQKSSYPTGSSGPSSRVLLFFVILGGFVGIAYTFAEKIVQKIVMEVRAK
jgi:uncharacterized protein involved in exopolysaccharide biosynthesis